MSLTYYIDVLPIHPHPKQLESFTSYLTRIAEANGIASAQALSAICFPGKNPRSTRIFADFPPVSFGALPTVTTCSESELQATTFYFLGEKFGRSTKPHAIGHFLNGTIASSLRYCPACLAKQGYYSLIWRFLLLPGCAEHECRLLDRCGHCGRRIPFITAPLRVGICPWCRKSLTNCRTKPLSRNEFRALETYYRDILFLLSPSPQRRGYPATSTGEKFAFWRQRNGLTLADVAKHIGAPVGRLWRFEHGEIHGIANFQDCVDYVRYLGVTFRDIFNTELPRQGKGADKRGWKRTRGSSEDELISQLLNAQKDLVSHGIPATQQAISEVVGLSMDAVRYYPRAKEALGRLGELNRDDSRTRIRVRENKLVADARKVVGEATTKPLTQRVFCKMIHISHHDLRRYPKTKAMWDQILENQRINRLIQKQKREEELVDKVSHAIDGLKSSGQPVTQRTVSNVLGVSRNIFYDHFRVRMMLQQTTGKIFPNKRTEVQLAEDDFVHQLNMALETLRSRGKPLTAQNIRDAARMSSTELNKYPRVKSIWNQIAADRDRERRRQVQSKEDQVVELVQTAMRHLRSQGKSVTQKAISQMVGKTVNGLRYYPKVKVILRVVAEECRHVRKMQRESRESGWVDKVQGAIKKLKKQGRPITYREISHQIHSSASALWRYPSIKAILKKATAKGNQQERESELLKKVWEAERALRAKGKSVTQLAISKELKMSPSGLRRYPRIMAIFAEMINERRNRMRANRKAV
jgi:transcriptional regulator with XRE-family HTH domain